MRILLLTSLLVCVAGTCARSTLSDPQCPTPRLKNGRIRARGRGRIIRYSCYADYELVGNKYSTCIRGSWDTPTPICVSTRCPTIPAPMHAVVGEKYRGAILMYFCEPGYQLVGNSEIYCDGRQWNGTTPYCRDTNAVAPTSCDFEKGLCWWEQDPKHDFDWVRHKFDTPSSHIGTGPTHDHTLGANYDGYYLYIEASGRLVNDAARIISPLYPSNLTESGCFSFWYHMYGSTIGSLNVYFKLENEQPPKLMWTKQGNQGNQWLRGLFALPAVNTSFQVIIEGVRGTSYVSDIAIDDLAILQGDECILKDDTTPAVPVADGDEVEIFNAIQSCKGRCSLIETTPSPELYSNPDVCQCTMDCAESSSCCPDYAEYCVYEFTEAMETTMPWSLGTSSATESIARQASNRTEEATSEQPSLPTSTPAFQQTPDRISQTTTTPSTTSTAITTITAATATPPTTTPTAKFTIPTSKARVTSVETKPTAPPSTASSKRTTFFNPSVTRRKDLPSTSTGPHAIIQNARQLEPESRFRLTGIVGAMISALTAVAVAVALALLVLRLQRYRRPCSSSAFAEDSDVRYLTSDEQLDFNLARPADD
ncbi:MAM and LDL-receptor class A domain-containing protein 2-like isoform X2 [Phymastichus coffea]|uniref:MAM and LDL-receptor class A domain-containing protein 2-like isoform X2 n=1 Tax=Phymastichus coffea TaxID=108790 RepID=UPI00273B02E4|nr:MAM and LDL-receptor class A domain-containing protein 2-like isoform X2 [Phymastichus coffea]